MAGGSGRTSLHGEWSSRWTFILATVGSAVGLGNIWKFPYISGVNGGGAFVVVYLVCIAIVGVPIMMAEIMIGRRARRSPINAMRTLAGELRASRLWSLLGWSGVVAGFLILSYYSVVAGWAVGYVLNALGGRFTGIGADGVVELFEGMVADPVQLLGLHTVFMFMTMVVVAHGVQRGLERAVSVMMPALFALLVILVIYSMTTTGAFMQGLAFMFEPDFSKITPAGVLVAMGHAFFTLSLGMGAVMVYGSYMPGGASIARATLVIVAADTLVALLAGMIIFPLVFANGLEPGQGPGLLFQTLPIAFGQMPAGALFGTLFFVLLTFAAWSSSISLIEPAVAYLVENRGLSRVAAATMCGIATWLVGIGTILSFNHWSEYTLLDLTFFELVDFLTANIMLPVGGLFIAIFAGWLMPRAVTRAELSTRSPAAYAAWRVLVRYVSPVAVIIIVLNLLGLVEVG